MLPNTQSARRLHVNHPKQRRLSLTLPLPPCDLLTLKMNKNDIETGFSNTFIDFPDLREVCQALEIDLGSTSLCASPTCPVRVRTLNRFTEFFPRTGRDRRTGVRITCQLGFTPCSLNVQRRQTVLSVLPPPGKLSFSMLDCSISVDPHLAMPSC